MPEIESLERAYFKQLRLGDFVRKAPVMEIRHSKPTFKSSQAAKKAHTHTGGCSAYYVVTIVIAFKRGFLGTTESRSQFWDRVRQFGIDLIDAIAPQSGHSQAGPLSMVRNPTGGRFTKDRTTLTGPVTANPGFGVTCPVADDVDSGDFSWEVGQKLIFIDPSNPSTFDWENGDIISFGLGGTQIEVDLDHNKQSGAEVFRLESLWPEVALFNDPKFDAGGPAGSDFIKEIELQFAGTRDPEAGDLGS